MLNGSQLFLTDAECIRQWQHVNLPITKSISSVGTGQAVEQFCCFCIYYLLPGNAAHLLAFCWALPRGPFPCPMTHDEAVLQTHVPQRYVQPTPFEAPHQPSFYEDEDNECVVCMDSEATQFFNPCGHVLCCQACAEKIMHNSKLCPVCNTAIAEFGFCSWAQVH